MSSVIHKDYGRGHRQGCSCSHIDIEVSSCGCNAPPKPVGEDVASTEKVQLKLRLPPDLHAALVADAKAQRKSLNGLIVEALRDAAVSALLRDLQERIERLEGISLNVNEISNLPATSGVMEISAALRNIASFGKRHPGHGYSCAIIAEQALAQWDGNPKGGDAGSG